MNRYMMEEFHNDPALFHRLAHRARNRAILEAIGSLAGYVKAHLAARSGPRPAGWIERLG